jgi:hypothetical protein
MVARDIAFDEFGVTDTPAVDHAYRTKYGR